MPFQKNIKLIKQKTGSYLSEHSSLPFIGTHIDSLAAKENTPYSFGRAALFACRRKKAALTVETAIVLPVFMFFCIAVVFFIQIFSMHTEIQGGLYRTARSLASNLLIVQTGMRDGIAGAEEAASFISIASARQQVADYAEEQLNQSVCLKGGVDGLSFYYSSFSEDMIDLIVHYEVELPYLFGINITFPVVQRCRMHAWVGSDGSGQADEAEEMVYVTETGRVYHKNSQCSHLKLSIQTVGSFELAARRNESGGKYYPCEKCAPDGLTGAAGYVTGDGNRYHNTLSCSGLKRTILVVPKSQVNGKSACLRCWK